MGQVIQMFSNFLSNHHGHRATGGPRVLRAGGPQRQLAGHPPVPRGQPAAEESQVPDEVPRRVQSPARVQVVGGAAVDDGVGGEPGVVLGIPAPGGARRGVRLRRVVRRDEL